MLFEVINASETGLGSAGGEEVSVRVKKREGRIHNIHLTDGESIWVETPGGSVRLAYCEKINISIYGPQGGPVELRKGRAKIIYEK